MSTTIRRAVRVGETVTLELPYSEVCMHLRVAGQHRPVQVLQTGAQVLNEDGTDYSFPILHGEAGIFTREDGTLWADVDRTIRDLHSVTFVRDVEDLEDRGEGYDWYPVPSPTEGTKDHPVTLSWGRWRECSAADATHAVLNLTVWSDYSGSTVERSNERALREDYPRTFVQLYGGHGTSGLMLPVDRPADWFSDDDDGGRDRWLCLLEDLASLADYPLYSEEDLFALEAELADEAWDAWLCFDVPSALRDAGVSEDALEDTDRLREMFYRVTGEQPVSYEAETADSVIFPYFKDTIATMAAELREVSS